MRYERRRAVGVTNGEITWNYGEDQISKSSNSIVTATTAEAAGTAVTENISNKWMYV